jgi:ribosomal protein S7
MARLELIHGKDPLTRRLAEEIIASQTAEIAAMKKRLAILRRLDDTNRDDYPALHGTRGE